jgi:glycosyltransferase involved in cell wall biosynthesis
MRIAILHNRYVYRGGEDSVVDTEAELLRKAGHEVELFTVDNREAIAGSPLGAVRAGLRARWNSKIMRQVGEFVARKSIEVAHVHNFFPLLSPAVHTALSERGIPVVQTLHNYRLLCANGMFLREERTCEDCVVRGPWNAVRHGCYRGSRLQTAVSADQTATHRRRGTWRHHVDCFTVPSAFARVKLLAAGLPPERVLVKPNSVPDPGEPRYPGRGAVFVGRLSREKGVHLLLEAWRQMDGSPLTIAGTGTEEARLREQAAEIPGVRFLGQVDHDAVIAALQAAAFTIVPSIWYENFPVALAEAMACGRPSVAASPSALDEFVDHGRTGLRFESGNAGALAAACAELMRDSERTTAMGREARADYEDRLTPEACVAGLIGVYARAASVRAARTPVPAQ